MIQEMEFDFDSEKLRPALLTGHSPAPSPTRAKTALRLKYEAESEVIRRKLGDLEVIRSQLGLSQRKMAQLLLVDPSAWTRWTKGGESAPPHIYRMLQWYLALEEKYPVLDVNFWLNTVSQLTDQQRVPELESELVETRSRIVESHSRLDRFESALRLTTSTLEAIRLEMNQKDKQTRRLFLWIAASIIASSFICGVLISLLTA